MPPIFQDTSIIFDLDGTLVDTAPDLTEALNHVLVAEGRQAVDGAQVRHMVGHGAREMIRAGMAATGDEATEDDLDRMMSVFLDHYIVHIADNSRPFDGVVKVLETLQNQSALLGVCTNKRERLSVALLQTLKIDHFFGAIIGADTLPVRKPDPQHLLGTIERIGGNKDRAVMIGDSTTDVKAAKAAGVPVVTVSFGYPDVPPAELGGDANIDHYDQLLETISTLL